MSRVSEIRPGDTLVLPVIAGGWKHLGFIPNAEFDPAESQDNESSDDDRLLDIDVADKAFEVSKRREIVRVFWRRMKGLPTEDSATRLRDLLADQNSPLTKRELRDLIADTVASTEFPRDSIWNRCARLLASRSRIDRYADGQPGIVISSTMVRSEDVGVEDDGDDDLCDRSQGQRISLESHLCDVEQYVASACSIVSAGELKETLCAAARVHDWGKCDARFQAMLVRGDLQTAWSQPRLWAKSDEAITSRNDWEAIRTRAKLPSGFRHEMLSVQLAEQAIEGIDDHLRDLLLHLVASHHGYARPFAPICLDDDPLDVEYTEHSSPLRLSADWRTNHPHERIDSGIAERFWKATRTFGWWGVAYLETLLRLADQTASAHPSKLVGIVDENAKAHT